MKKPATSSLGIDPVITRNLDEAARIVRRDGAVIFDGVGASADDATNLGHRVFGDRVLTIPEAARVFEGGEQDRKIQLDHHKPLRPHTDGFAYGDLYPDFIMLTCVHASEIGGESFLVDGYALLDELGAAKDARWLPEALERVAVDQTEEDMQVSQSPIVQRVGDGRKMLRRTFNQAPLPSSTQPELDKKMIDDWVTAVDKAGEVVPRFRIEPGQALILDNYRMLHAREGYEDAERMMWRVWIWTDECQGVPDMPLHSDSRYAVRGE